MPWPKLKTSLVEATKGRMLQVDDKGLRLPAELSVPSGVDATVWKKFQKSVCGNEVYFEVTIS
jgi:hypothetical protein